MHKVARKKFLKKKLKNKKTNTIIFAVNQPYYVAEGKPGLKEKTIKQNGPKKKKNYYGAAKVHSIITTDNTNKLEVKTQKKSLIAQTIRNNSKITLTW